MSLKLIISLIIIFILLMALTKLYAGEGEEVATFAGGCFWCVEAAFDDLEGVIEAVSGYTGGGKKNPTYEQVCSGKTGHKEAVQVTYNPAKVSYQQLLDIFWQTIDPTDPKGQFVDQGSQYRTAIFYHNRKQKELAEESKKSLEKSGKYTRPIVTEIIAADRFYKAEDYHQDYYKKCPIRYKSYKDNSGRKASLKQRLTPLQYKVTQEEGTERAFHNEYWNNKRAGIYVDIISGEPLFSSLDKFDSGTGWPSFTKPLEPDNIAEKQDNSLFISRTAVKSKNADSHLGHVFNDGPAPTGRRYCLNSASLKFIPKEDLEKEGYGQYKNLF